MECRHLDGNVKNNQSHNLKWDTKQANWNDKRLHGTATHGENNVTSILTDAQVIEMRELRRQGWKYRELVVRFNTCFGNVAAILQGRAWKHLLPETHNGLESRPE